MLLFRTPVLTFGKRGVKPADFAALGLSASPLANDADLPADADHEWLWALLSPLPGSGTTQVNDSGGYALTGASDGVYTQAYRGLVMPPTGAVTVYESSITVTVGAAGVGVAVETDAALALAAKQIAPVGLSIEISSALALGSAASTGLSVETDTALALPGRVVLPTGMAVETSTALALLAGYGASPAIETDTALALTGRQIRAVGLSLETDVAYALPAAIPGVGGTIDPAAFWGYILSNGLSVGDNIVAIKTAMENRPTVGDIANAVWNKVLP